MRRSSDLRSSKEQFVSRIRNYSLVAQHIDAPTATKRRHNYEKIRRDGGQCRISKHRPKRALAYVRLFSGVAKGTLKILQELLNHGGLVAVVRAGITYLTSKCPAGAGSPFRILFHDRTLNHDASVAFNDTVSCVLVEYAFFSVLTNAPFSYFAPMELSRNFALRNSVLIPGKRPGNILQGPKHFVKLSTFSILLE